MPSLTRRQILASAAATAAVAAMPAAVAIAAVEEAPATLIASERVDFAYFVRNAFLDGGGSHARFAVEFPNYAWTIACDVMAKSEETA
jgi:hypothetical protein